MANYKSILASTFKFEGGYQASPNDSANYTSKKVLVGTNRGISAIALEEYWRVTGKNGQPTVADIKALTSNDAEKIYKKLFWDKIRGDEIKDQFVAWIIFDAFIASGNNGISRVRKSINKYYQKDAVQISTKPFDNNDVFQINSAKPDALFEVIKAGEVQNRKDIAASNPSKAKFLKGWLSRLESIKYVKGMSESGGNVQLFFLRRAWNSKLGRIAIIATVGVAGLGIGYLIYKKVKK